MRRFLLPLSLALRLNLRNPMATLYGYLFPTIFLVAFAVLYRWEPVPLVRHVGELLTVTALGGACFGLPTALVAERERGVWRRYRLTPVSTASVVAVVVAARYLLLLSAALLQLVLAGAIGMPMPAHPLQLWMAFTAVSFAFLGLGLVIAMLADTVPAVQALGQSIFLPMLIIGGVAVRLEALPAWAQHLSAFFPGRYAVEAIQATVDGAGLPGVGFALAALLVTGAAGCLAAARMFRWDAGPDAVARGRRGWVAVAVAAWLAVGLTAEALGLAGPRRAATEPPVDGEPLVLVTDSAAPAPLPPDTVSLAAALESIAPTARDSVAPPAAPGTPADSAAATLPPRPAPVAPPGEPDPAAGLPPPATAWNSVTTAHLAEIVYDRLPPDGGVVTPIAPPGERPPTAGLEREILCVRDALPDWPPARVADPVQRVRNLLYVAALPDIFQMEQLEPWLPRVVFDRLRETVPREQLVQILFWIATHPREGATGAAGELKGVCIDTGGRPTEVALLRERTAVYAVKLLGRLTGRIPE